jgi:hypothetical protein
MSRRPGVFTGDSGIPKITPSRAITTSTPGSQNSHGQDRFSTIGPAATMPIPAPMPKIADSSPMVTPTLSCGNSSRTTPMDSGMIAPAAPCSARATISTPRFGASAASTVPASSRLRTTIRMRRLPTMSPRRPRIGVSTAADSRYALRIQDASPVVTPRSVPIVDNAGATSDCSTANDNPPRDR